MHLSMHKKQNKSAVGAVDFRKSVESDGGQLSSVRIPPPLVYVFIRRGIYTFDIAGTKAQQHSGSKTEHLHE